MKVTKSQLTQQWNQAKENGLAPLIIKAAQSHGLPPAYLAAVGSRETNLTNILGDNGHGHGVLQIDNRYHEQAIEAAGDWKSHPEKLIDYGASLLASNLVWARKNWPKYTDEQHLKIAASAYNAGQGGAKKGVLNGDSDQNTTGKDYGKDVIERYHALTGILA